ncbi:MAG: Fur family transcriptional regulator [Pseudobdellovibrionaceae bacterium]
MTRNTKPQLEAVQQFCQEQGLRLTPVRESVFKALLAHEKPVGAYQLLEDLRETLDNPKPPTIYRAIEFWLQAGLIHKIESLNAYTVCRNDHAHPGSQFLVCDSCGDIAETHLCHLPESLNQQVSAQNFQMKYWNTEIHGLCAQCAQSR